VGSSELPIRNYSRTYEIESGRGGQNLVKLSKGVLTPRRKIEVSSSDQFRRIDISKVARPAEGEGLNPLAIAISSIEEYRKRSSHYICNYAAAPHHIKWVFKVGSNVLFQSLKSLARWR